jgi:hypothetical protein
MLLYAAEQRRLRRAKADAMEAVAAGYGGCKSKEGSDAMTRMLAALRHED